MEEKMYLMEDKSNMDNGESVGLTKYTPLLLSQIYLSIVIEQKSILSFLMFPEDMSGFQKMYLASKPLINEPVWTCINDQTHNTNHEF